MLPSLKQIYNDNHQAPGNIVVPFTDGIRGLQIYLPLQESIEQEGKTVSKTLEKNITLALSSRINNSRLKRATTIEIIIPFK